jgi:ferredoxin-NADP reductase
MLLWGATNASLERQKSHKCCFGEPQMLFWRGRRATNASLERQKSHKCFFGEAEEPQMLLWRDRRATNAAWERQKSHKCFFGEAEEPQKLRRATNASLESHERTIRSTKTIK